MARKTTTPKKKSPARARASKSTASPKAAPPAATSTTDPPAEELAAQGLALLSQALLLGQQPADPSRPSPAFGIQELERGLAAVVGQRYAARLQRLDVAIRALEARVLSEEEVDQMSPDDRLKLYRLAVPELHRGPKYIKDLLSLARAVGGGRASSSLLRTKR